MTGKVLLTNIFISNYTGSELDTLQTAKWFKKNHWDVEVATLQKKEPLLHLFAENDIKVTDVWAEQLSSQQYDLLWGHHWPLISYIIFHEKAVFQKLIHHCLGALEPLESAVPFHNEIPIYFSISEVVKQILIDVDGVDEKKIQVFTNSAEEIYFEKYKTIVPNKLRKIGIISNHVPEELAELKEFFEPLGIEVFYIGMYNNYMLVDVDLIMNYDLIITIGRTVQQCFACGVPVYCYDIYGGPGYIDKNNIDIAEKFNFSGRGFANKMTCTQIAEDILKNYPNALDNISFLHDIALERYRFEEKMAKAMKLIDSAPEFNGKMVRERYRQYMRPNEAYIQAWKRMADRENEVSSLVTRVRKAEADLASKLNDIDDMQQRLSKYNVLLTELEKDKNRLEEEKNRLEEEINRKDNELQHISGLYQQASNDLNCIINSRSWRATKFIRKIVSVLLPYGSKRRALLKRIFKRSPKKNM